MENSLKEPEYYKKLKELWQNSRKKEFHEIARDWYSLKKCTHSNGHTFRLVRNKEEKEIIKEIFPDKLLPFWTCIYCGSLNEST